MKNIDLYQTVSCEMYSELELAIMHGKSLLVCYVESNHSDREQTTRLKPNDVITRRKNEKAEFLMATNESGELLEIRLDKIKHYTVE